MERKIERDREREQKRASNLKPLLWCRNASMTAFEPALLQMRLNIVFDPLQKSSTHVNVPFQLLGQLSLSVTFC